MNRLRRREVLIVALGVALTALPAVLLIYGQPSSAEDPPAKGLPPAATEPIDSEKLQAESENAMDRFVLEEFPALGLDPPSSTGRSSTPPTMCRSTHWAMRRVKQISSLRCP